MLTKALRLWLVLAIVAGCLASAHADDAPAYFAQDIHFRGASPEVQLAGTFTRPQASRAGQRFPAVLLIHGSGPADRDETIANHHPFRTIAEYLTAQGYAVLRYDKRGTGESTGPAEGLTLADYTADAEAAFEALRERPDVDPKRTGLLGHSEGGVIAPLIAGRNEHVAWLILLGAPTVPGRDIVLYQNEQGMLDRGRSREDAQAARETSQSLFEIVLRDEPDEQRADELQAALEAVRVERNLPPKFVDEQRRVLLSPWFRATLAYDPLPALKAVKQPVLALYGALDHQVPPSLNQAPAREALRLNPRSKVRVLSGLNHLFFAAKTGAVSEYATIPTGVEPAALDATRDWLKTLRAPH